MFDSVNTHFAHLQRPMKKEELNTISLSALQSITLFLVSDRTAQLFTAWLEHRDLAGDQISKETVLDCILKLESQPDLQL